MYHWFKFGHSSLIQRGICWNKLEQPMQLCQGQVHEVLQRLPLCFPCQGPEGSCFWLVKHVGVSGLASMPNSLIFQKIRELACSTSTSQLHWKLTNSVQWFGCYIHWTFSVSQTDITAVPHGQKDNSFDVHRELVVEWDFRLIRLTRIGLCYLHGMVRRTLAICLSEVHHMLLCFFVYFHPVRSTLRAFDIPCQGFYDFVQCQFLMFLLLHGCRAWLCQDAYDAMMHHPLSGLPTQSSGLFP